ncbi:MAG: hypothetical protein PUK22_00780 [Bacteroides sp.]|nr:hypothetical protein [Bacteroides sp.]
MKDRRNDWKSQLRDRMEVYGEPEPDGLWESVASSLRQKGVMAGSGVAESASSSGNLLRDRRHLWWYVVPALAMAAVCVGLLLPFSGGESQVTVVPGNMISESIIADKVLEGDADNVAPAKASVSSNERLASNGVPVSGERPVLDEMSSEEKASAGDAFGGVLFDVDATVSPSQECTVVEQQEPKARREQEFSSEDGFEDPFAEEMETSSASKRSRLALGLHLGGVGSYSGGSSGSVSMADAFVSSTVPFGTNNGTPIKLDSKGKLPYNGVLMGDTFRSVESEHRFYQPVSVGVEVSCDLGRRFFLGSGLSYTCLVSESSSGSSESRSSLTQTVHLLGVPLKLGYKIIDNPLFELSVAGGGRVDKAIASKTVTRLALNGPEPVRSASTGTVFPLYWSLTASASAAYKLSSLVGLYLEPGLSWHFSSKSDSGLALETVWSGRPLNFQLNAGVRFYF